MTQHRIIVIALAASFYSTTQLVIAQTTIPVQDERAYTAPTTSPAMVPAAGGTGGVRTEGSPIAPMNVLEDVPRDMRGNRVRTLCDNEPVDDQMPGRCLRWSEIARTL
jgi:hypothetical protein